MATAICANPEMEHHYEVASFDLPTVHTIDVVPGTEAYDPECGGEPIGGWPEPYEPIDMTFIEAKKPAPKKKGKKATKTAAKKTTAKKTATKKGSKKSPS